jgi:hypothetical protein
VSQSSAPGDAYHPGGLVRTWSPPPPAGPPPTPPNTTLQYVWAMGGAVDKGWLLSAGVGAAGTIKYAPSGLCLAVSTRGVPVLAACVPSTPDQMWVLEANGNVHLQTAHEKDCLALANGRGPGVLLFRCIAVINQCTYSIAVINQCCSSGV